MATDAKQEMARYWEKNEGLNRPISPHISIYRYRLHVSSPKPQTQPSCEFEPTSQCSLEPHVPRPPPPAEALTPTLTLDQKVQAILLEPNPAWTLLSYSKMDQVMADLPFPCLQPSLLFPNHDP
ncbi:hypothetical protein chiPu_0028677, partial [Chiloscyllium punctatum]|nr:hypothetical protein [Chiloscyllium punctatum]